MAKGDLTKIVLKDVKQKEQNIDSTKTPTQLKRQMRNKITSSNLQKKLNAFLSAVKSLFNKMMYLKA